ncbi:hypothetical protein [Pseudomonas sp. LP_7_YM]|uniref:hypothetical protein n=1 Tax=Pseudomonas sp. LP_7_YM TaxID=2485137 RepID=UPI00105D5EA8|nr:hypothetical protein [Pseudomonas sp. LP_7_YM]TDV72670.1 hypothetical protein EC915_101817 [Pseudomonas sp. LP_7_YM]
MKKKGRMDGPHAMDKRLTSSHAQNAEATGRMQLRAESAARLENLNAPTPRDPVHDARSGQQTVQIESGSLPGGDVRLGGNVAKALFCKMGWSSKAMGQASIQCLPHSRCLIHG